MSKNIMAEDSLFSQLEVYVTKLQCRIIELENKCENRNNYLQVLNSLCEKEKEKTKRLNESIEELLSKEKLLKENIERVNKSNSAAEESLRDLKNQVVLEETKTRQLKAEQDKTLAKYIAYRESYLKIYNDLPLVKERNELDCVVKAKAKQILVLKQKMIEVGKKQLLMEQIKEKMDQDLLKKMAETYKKYIYEKENREQLLNKIREVKQDIEKVKAEKTSLVGNNGNKDNERARPVGMAAAAAIVSAKKRKRPHSFETNPSIRKRQKNRLLQKVRKSRNEITITPVSAHMAPKAKEDIVLLPDDDEETDSADRLVIDEGRDTTTTTNEVPADEVPECQGCRQRSAQFVCAGCGNQWYCSRECQVTAWEEHSEMCSG